MQSVNRSLAAVATLAVAGVLSVATPASALSLANCGTVEWPANMSVHGSVCELKFPDGGDYSWTVRNGASDMYAMLIGGGGGAIVDVFAPTPYGFAGSGGEVVYVDLTSATGGSVIDATVGAGGASGGSPTSGGDTVLSIGGVDYTADGGVAGDQLGTAFGYCNPGFAGNYGEGVGAGVAGTPASGGACTGGQPGINPSTDPSAPAVFSDDDTEYGHGGGISSDGSGIVYTKGSGGSMSYSNTYGDGSSGYIVIRFAFSNSAGSSSGDKLAETGNSVPVPALTLGSLAAIAVGVVATVARRSRRTL